MTDPTTVEELVAPDAAAPARRTKSSDKDSITRVDSKTAKKVKIIIPKTKDEKNDVYVCVNGTDFLIKRGVEVSVPDFVVSTLRNSIESRMDEDGNWSEVPCYPFSIVG